MTKFKKVWSLSGLAAIAALALAMGAEIRFPAHLSAEEYWTDGLHQAAQSPAPQVDVNALNSVFTSIAEKLSPSVVNIYTKTKFTPAFRGYAGDQEELFRFFFSNPFEGQMPMRPREQEAQTLGSGFIINKDGYIVTNSHVVRPMQGKNADEVMVKFLKEDQGKGYPATIVGVDERSDVALLKLKNPKPNLTVAPLANSDNAKVGEWVVAIGNPYGHAHTVTQGIVSATGRNIEDSAAEFIQTSASINPGNSGGPLFNLYGEVVGINTAIDPRAQGIGFAIPINFAKPAIHDLIRDGKVSHGWIGLAITTVTPDVADSLGLGEVQGALVRGVAKGSPAEKAGLLKGDVITKISGQVITGQEKLVQLVSTAKVGQTVDVELLRKGQHKTLTVHIGEEPTNVQLQS